MPAPKKSIETIIVDVARKSKRAAISIALMFAGLIGGGFAKDFIAPLNIYVSWFCIFVSAIGATGLLLVFAKTFLANED